MKRICILCFVLFCASGVYAQLQRESPQSERRKKIAANYYLEVSVYERKALFYKSLAEQNPGKEQIYADSASYYMRLSILRQRKTKDSIYKYSKQ